MNRLNLFATVTLTLATLNLQASDLEKEKRWASQIVDALLDGEALYLNDGRSDFLTIETPSMDGNTRKTAIILHGTGVHPDWPTVIQPLRVGLTESDWHTLSIQMPILPNEAKHAAYASIYDWVPGRIDAAIKHARDNGAETLVLIGHSQGTTMAAYYLANGDKPVDGFIAVGMGPGVAGGPMDNMSHLKTLKTPMLDLYGSMDLEEIVASADQRKTAATPHNHGYTQIQLEGADHFFDGEEDRLLKQVNAWLQKTMTQN
ncbi:MAG: alpha/beta hydrolase family protein [Candidatus Thiodiazotropha sp. (ex Notomyrtea botanica)]|nr:alpha/beta hydrolase family protein [Candidatus Thiodiazotropha sp. (ex Notomyrtea botanica)]